MYLVTNYKLLLFNNLYKLIYNGNKPGTIFILLRVPSLHMLLSVCFEDL